MATADHRAGRGAAARRREVPRRVRGAAQGRAARGHASRGRDHPLHRRAAHDRRRGRGRGRGSAGNLLKPALARGELRCIGATTLDEYRKHIEKDAAFERRFQPVYVGEPSVEDTVAILRGLKERYEAHHGVRIQDAALIAAANLSHRYIADRFLPDKAIDLVDEAASRCASRTTRCPPSWMNCAGGSCSWRSSARRSKSNRMRLEGESAPRPIEQDWAIELNELRKRALTAQWDAEKAELDASRTQGADRRKHVELEQAQRNGDLEAAARIQYGDSVELDRGWPTPRPPSPERQHNGEALVKEEVTPSRSPRSSLRGRASRCRG
jgi:ATP-dependent Clp protease ATP-binding subunit ClpB